MECLTAHARHVVVYQAPYGTWRGHCEACMACIYLDFHSYVAMGVFFKISPVTSCDDGYDPLFHETVFKGRSGKW